MSNTMPLIISGFPGIGKTHVVNSASIKGRVVADSDSSTFDKADFPDNYLNHIDRILSEGIPTLISSHASVRQGLEKRGISYTLVYPEHNLKNEYLQRYRNRRSPDAFIEMMAARWDEFIGSCDDSYPYRRIRLQQGQYLSDVLKSFDWFN